MKIIESLQEFKRIPSCLALGNFDGVHPAHQSVLSACVKMAKKKQAEAGVLLFRNFPKPMISSIAERMEMMEQCGISFVFLADFEKDFQELSPEAFVELLKNHSVCGVSVGYDYRFGKDAKGDIKMLQKLAEGMEVFVTPPIVKKSRPIASSDIRTAIEKADFSAVFDQMGRRFSIEGIVKSGFQNGRKLGFATANLVPEEKRVLPPDGVYSGWSYIEGKRIPSVINIGKNPTFSGKIRTVESHLIDFSGDLYGKKMKVEFYRKIRDEKRFADVDALREQISADCKEARKDLEMMNTLFTGVILKAKENHMNSEKDFGELMLCGKTFSQRMSGIFEKAGAERVIPASECAEANLNGTVVILPENMPFLSAETICKMMQAHQESENVITIAVNALNGEKLPIVVSDADAIDFSDICGLFKQEEGVGTFAIAEELQLTKITDRVELAKAEAQLQKAINEMHMQNGVTMLLPETILIEEGVLIGADTVIYPNVILKAGTKIGKHCVIGSNTQIENSEIANGVDILSSVIVDSFVDEGTHVGPFAYIRPNTRVGKSVKVGDFVELKNANIGDGTKISHLTYVGDADVGERVNFGCGTVTVNYDGKKKYRTTIGDDCFIGCNTNLVAPVTVEDGGYTAAGSTITDTVPEKALAIARARQVNKTEWKDRRK